MVDTYILFYLQTATVSKNTICTVKKLYDNNFERLLGNINLQLATGNNSLSLLRTAGKYNTRWTA